MKKFISIAVAAAMVGVMGLTVAAQGPKNENVKERAAQTQATVQQKKAECEQNRQQRKEAIEQKKAELEQIRKQFKDKKEEWKGYQKELAKKRGELMSHKGLNQDLLKENKQLRTQLRTALEEIEEAGTALPEETAAALKDYREQLKAIADQMKAEKGKIRDLLKQNKELIKNKDYVKMDLIYDQIADIQITRNDLLKQINDIFVKMIELL